MTLLPNGDWLDWENVWVWISIEEGVDMEQLVDDTIEALVEVIAGRAYRLWIRSKWNAAEAAICDQGLAILVNNLRVHGFEEWAAMQIRKRKTIPPYRWRMPLLQEEVVAAAVLVVTILPWLTTSRPCPISQSLRNAGPLRVRTTSLRGT